MDDFDQRIQRLTERHEALAQSAELFQHELAELGEKLRVQSDNIDKLRVESVAQQLLLTQVLEGMKQLIEVATSHKRRLGNLERA